MQRIFGILTAGTILSALFFTTTLRAQTTDTTNPVSVNPELQHIFDSKIQKEYTIAGIKVTGVKFLDESLLLSLSALSVGDVIDLPGSDKFSKAIQKLWEQKLFSNVQIFITRLEGRNLYIEINVTERPRLSNFYFKGIRKGEAEDLEPKTALVKSRVVTENMKLTAIQNIQKFYTDKGYQSADVRVEEKPDPGGAKNFETLTFYITKGPKVRISDINFFGNENAKDVKLKAQMKGTHEMSRLTLFPVPNHPVYGYKPEITFHDFVANYDFMFPTKIKDFMDPWVRFKMFTSAKFDQTKYDEDKQHLIEYYNSIGYRDAAILADTTYFTSKGTMNVDMKLSEGEKYYFGSINWKGNTKYSDSVLAMILDIHKGELYNLHLLNKKLGVDAGPEGGDIKSLYMDDGYLFFRIEPVETRVYHDTIDYEIRMVEGPQATIKNVNISGNDKTKEYVIRRELSTVPGDKFSRLTVIRTVREIAQLGFFNQEKINPVPVPHQEDGTVDIDYDLEEKSADQLELSAGWGGNIGLTGTLGVTLNNFSLSNIFHKKSWDPLPSGDGQKLSARIQANGKSYRAENISFTEPWFGGKKRNSFTVSLYNTRYSNAYSYNYSTGTYVTNHSDTSHMNILGVGVALGKALRWPDDYFTLTYGLNYNVYQLHDYYGYFPDMSTGTSNNINLKITLARNSLNNPQFPSQGSNLMLSVQATPPYSKIGNSPYSWSSIEDKYRWVEYHKWRMDAEWYIPLGVGRGEDKNRQLVLRLAGKFGFIGRYDNMLPISPFERFQLGDAGLTNNFGILGYEIISQRGYPVYYNSNPKINPDNGTSTTGTANPNQLFTIFNKYVAELRYPLSLSSSSTIYGLGFFEAANGWYDWQHYDPFTLRRSVGLGMRFFLPMFGLLGFDYGIGLDRLEPGQGLKNAGRFTFMLGYEPE
jgi:outer membrane protein insertion porin family